MKSVWVMVNNRPSQVADGSEVHILARKGATDSSGTRYRMPREGELAPVLVSNPHRRLVSVHPFSRAGQLAGANTDGWRMATEAEVHEWREQERRDRETAERLQAERVKAAAAQKHVRAMLSGMVDPDEVKA